MPSASSPEGRWRGWWEGVVDLVPAKGGNRGFSIESLFQKGLPHAFPEADSSKLRVILPDDQGFRMDAQPTDSEASWIDGRLRNIAEWDLLDGQVPGKDIRFWWDEEGEYQHRGPDLLLG